MSDAIFHPPALGARIRPGRVDGYWVDLRPKAAERGWPPPWFEAPAGHRFVAIAQWALGCYERYLHGEGEEWLASALSAGDYFVQKQEPEGLRAGGWVEPRDFPHTLPIRGPWLSAMAQGQGASLLVRLFAETSEARFAESARQGLAPLAVPSSEGGVRALLGGHPFLEEFPTEPPSFVLNGSIFALWGLYDVGVALADERAREGFAACLAGLTANIERWDTGSWSRYDLYPHRVVNVASSRYHALHILQLRVLGMLSPAPELERARERFEAYAASPLNRVTALARKAAFRLLVPK